MKLFEIAASGKIYICCYQKTQKTSLLKSKAANMPYITGKMVWWNAN
jgi:hypothetical protein